MKPSCQMLLRAVALGVILTTSGCVLPTVSLHTYRTYTMTVTDAKSGKPVPALPVEVLYSYNPTDSPIVLHRELRTPRDQKVTTRRPEWRLRLGVRV